MNANGLLPYSQKLPTDPYPEPDEASPPHHSKINFNIILLPSPRSPKRSLSLRFPCRGFVGISQVYHMCYMSCHLMFLDLTSIVIFGEEYKVMTNITQGLCNTGI